MASRVSQCIPLSSVKEGSQPRQLLTMKVLLIPLTFFFRRGHVHDDYFKLLLTQ